VVHTIQSFGFYSSNYKKSVPKTLSVECSWSCLVTCSTTSACDVTSVGTAVPGIRVRSTLPALAVGGHKKLSSWGTISSAVWHCGVGADVADVSNGCSGFSRSTLNMAALGSFETSAATPHRHRISEDFNPEPTYTVLDGLGFLSFHSRRAFHLQARNVRGKCCLAEQCAGLVATVCPSQAAPRLLQHCDAACWLVHTTGSIAY